MTLVIGAIADDPTGATDLASTLVNEGVRTAQVLGIPSEGADLGDAEAVVVALKSRSAPVEDAVSASLKALHWLRARSARQILFKYCSTFDSTPKGNIGPVADALADALETDFALICPSFPENARTVYQGHLFVGDQLLSDSPMKVHPLTPMRESSLIRLMQAQSTKRVGLVPLSVVRAGLRAIAERIAKLRMAGFAYGVADAIDDSDLRAVGRAAADHALVTGGSGVARGLPASFRAAGLLSEPQPPRLPSVAGRAVVLAGSCSAATRAQIARVRHAWPTRRIEVEEIFSNPALADEITAWAEAQSEASPVLIFASADPDDVLRTQTRYGRERSGEAIEAMLGSLAVKLRDVGFRRIVVAGGETSGAVVSALGIKSLRIGPPIAPGVPWCEADRLALALKSGNFGGETFFADAFKMLARATEPPRITLFDA